MPSSGRGGADLTGSGDGRLGSADSVYLTSFSPAQGWLMQSCNFEPGRPGTEQTEGQHIVGGSKTLKEKTRTGAGHARGEKPLFANAGVLDRRISAVSASHIGNETAIPELGNPEVAAVVTLRNVVAAEVAVLFGNQDWLKRRFGGLRSVVVSIQKACEVWEGPAWWKEEGTGYCDLGRDRHLFRIQQKRIEGRRCHKPYKAQDLRENRA
ncbi:hypothetical protein OE88DRAFT_1648504 [Heliocybe sulcata]|uniref:Uncharacterized protein n=1 Tax=Heliocybe sulcata TaxID=5364 RepID=A0A5C3MNZ1_9AGAM|nr:hypothetical protein OE88DRAFT_1648504 [Heliocybe sulcata]